MRIYGIDFTSAPTSRKPITCAVGELIDAQLTIVGVELWSSFLEFDSFLKRSGPWMAAIDFPFGQPQELIESLGWPSGWSDYVAHVGSMSKASFVDLINDYRSNQPKGKKHHLRQTDKLAKSCSPMMLFGVPVGKMFYEGAPRLEASDVSVWPCRLTESNRTVIEGYPALVSRYLLGRKSYKSESTEVDSKKLNRLRLLEGLLSESLMTGYRISVEIKDDLKTALIEDSKGDQLDAVLCAIQAACFNSSDLDKAAMNPQIDSNEGWIYDPTLDHEIAKTEA